MNMKRNFRVMRSAIIAIALAASFAVVAAPQSFKDILTAMKGKELSLISASGGGRDYSASVAEVGSDYVCFLIKMSDLTRCYPFSAVVWVNFKSGKEQGGSWAVALTDV